MDLFNETRSLVYLGPVLRRGRSDTGFTIAWSELVAALLDNYCNPPASGSVFRYSLLSSVWQLYSCEKRNVQMARSDGYSCRGCVV
jgi:hypothetical protein